MRAAFQTAAWQNTAAQTAASIADVAVGRLSPDIIENFWKNDKKPEEQRAAFVRFAFQYVCARDEQASAAWLLQQYPAHLNVTDIKKAALIAIRNDHEAMGGFLSDHLYPVDTKKDAARAAETILAEALEKSGKGLVERLLQKMPQVESALLYRAALGNRLENAKCLVEACRDRKTLLQEDLDRALVVAVKDGNVSLAQAFIDYGALPDACRKASMTRAAETADTVRGDLLEMLLQAGADPLHAAKKFPDSYAPAIQRIATAVQEKHRTVLQKETGSLLTIESLRGDQKNLGMTGLHYAARHRLLKDISLQGLTGRDLAQTNAQGQNLVEALVQAGDVVSLLQPQKWTGQRDILAQFVTQLPEKMQQEIDLPALLHAVDMQTLKSRSSGLRLKPKGF